MASGSNEVRSLLKNVELDGAIIIQKRKLLWLLGWVHDKSAAWKDLLDHWVEMGNDRSKLQGLEVNDKVVLTMLISDEDCQHTAVINWAGES